MIQENIVKLIQYGLATGLIAPEDAIFTANRVLELLKIDTLEETAEEEILGAVQKAAARMAEAAPSPCDPATPQPNACEASGAGPKAGCKSAASDDGTAEADMVAQLPDILGGICDYAYDAGILEENTIGCRDLFDTKVMGLLVDRPSNVVRQFNELYQIDPKLATDTYYKFSQDTDYIRRYRIARDMKWVAPTEYGDLDITINLSKPEKDPKAIAAARNAKQSSYPKCQLCMENEGYAGRLNHPARQNHRIIPVTINGSPWYFQYSPYVYYNEHCIVFNSQHVPMKIERATFAKLLNFVTQFPHYFVGSNADLPIVGGSILSHDHFQGGNYEFAMARAPIEKKVTFSGYEDVEAGIVKWPMSVIRIRSEQTGRLIDLADTILRAWRGYTDESAFIFSKTKAGVDMTAADGKTDGSDGALAVGNRLDGKSSGAGAPQTGASDEAAWESHNTITPIARKRGDKFELDLVLRNNITTKEHPLGVFHPHAELHHIKKENIGLIEVMGLAVLPARLKGELEHLKEAMVEGRDISGDGELSKHAVWVEELKLKYRNSTSTAVNDVGVICFAPGDIDRIIEDEVGLVFSKVLEHAGVYKRTAEGQAAFLRFVESVKQ
ncbi:MAG: UDP-glucose--hexose-1-phosphate uridylyltransferase [Lachnospiraceae bacterium]|nr:UDP-glucose--hexose-1-phosphate uridylyltransferase [Lachnospiraceae bacterium]